MRWTDERWSDYSKLKTKSFVEDVALIEDGRNYLVQQALFSRVLDALENCVFARLFFHGLSLLVPRDCSPCAHGGVGDGVGVRCEGVMARRWVVCFQGE